jgi:hypothetical protein
MSINYTYSLYIEFMTHTETHNMIYMAYKNIFNNVLIAITNIKEFDRIYLEFFTMWNGM